MAIAFVSNRAGAGNGSSSSTLAFSPIVTWTAGNLFLLCIVFDNVSTTVSNSNDCTGVTDNTAGGGNTWSKAHERTQSNGAAADGVTVAVFYSKLTNNITTSDTITVQFSASVTDKISVAAEFTIGGTPSLETTKDQHSLAGNGYGSNVIGSLSSIERLYAMYGGKESNSVNALDALSTSFSALSNARSRNNAAAVRTSGEYRINTSTGETSNPTHTISADTASVFIAISEATAGTLRDIIGGGVVPFPRT